MPCGRRAQCTAPPPRAGGREPERRYRFLRPLPATASCAFWHTHGALDHIIWGGVTFSHSDTHKSSLPRIGDPFHQPQPARDLSTRSTRLRQAPPRNRGWSRDILRPFHVAQAALLAWSVSRKDLRTTRRLRSAALRSRFDTTHTARHHGRTLPRVERPGEPPRQQPKTSAGTESRVDATTEQKQLEQVIAVPEAQRAILHDSTLSRHRDLDPEPVGALVPRHPVPEGLPFRVAPPLRARVRRVGYPVGPQDAPVGLLLEPLI